MRIGLYLHAFEHGGAERVVSRLSSILEQHGHDVFVLISDAHLHSYPLSGNLIDYHVPAGKGILGKLVVLFRRKSKLKRNKQEYRLDCVISFMEGANIVNVLAKNKNTKAIVSIRNHQSSELRKTSFKRFQKRIMQNTYRHADSIVCVSRVISDDLEQSFHVKKQKLRVLYNPYNVEAIQHEASCIDCVDPDLVAFIRSKSFCFVGMGRLSYQKGFWHLLKAFYLLNPAIHKFGLVIIGNGEQETKLKELSVALCIEDSVWFCGYQKNPQAIMVLCSAFILSSLFEGFPNALVEAMCLGLPVISSDCKSGPREIIAPELDISVSPVKNVYAARYGYILPPFSCKEDWSIDCEEEKLWADCLEKICRKTNELVQYSRKSIERSKYFSEESCYKKLISIISE